MLTLLLLLGLTIAGISADIALAWASVRLVGGKPTLGRVVLVEAIILAIALALLIAGNFNPWATDSRVSVLVGQAVAGTAFQLMLIWYVIHHGFRLSMLRAAGVVGIRVACSLAALAVVVLLIRPFLMETFVVNSGAMSPSVVGTHIEAACRQCGGTLIVPVFPGLRGMQPMSHGICAKCRAVSYARPSAGATLDRDHIVVNRLIRPGRWDIAAYQAPSGVWVSRIIGLPGETVHIANGDVFINGTRLPIPANLLGQRYLPPLGPAMKYASEDNPCTLSAGEYFLLSDFSLAANDSRFTGPVSEKDIVGTVGLRYWPMSRIGVP